MLPLVGNVQLDYLVEMAEKVAECAPPVVTCVAPATSVAQTSNFEECPQQLTDRVVTLELSSWRHRRSSRRPIVDVDRQQPHTAVVLSINITYAVMVVSDEENTGRKRKTNKHDKITLLPIPSTWRFLLSFAVCSLC